MIEIVDALGVTAVTAPGSPPKLNLTDSPSSSSVSCVAVTVNVTDVLGLIEGHAGGHAGVVGAARAILVVRLDRNRHLRFGSRFRVTVTSTVPPSATV